MRLTRRGVAALVPLTLALGVLLLLVARLSAGSPAGRGPRLGAGAVGGHRAARATRCGRSPAGGAARDPRQVVDQLRRLNHLALGGA